jgi:hypothetical protein
MTIGSSAFGLRSKPGYLDLLNYVKKGSIPLGVAQHIASFFLLLDPISLPITYLHQFIHPQLKHGVPCEEVAGDNG